MSARKLSRKIEMIILIVLPLLIVGYALMGQLSYDSLNTVNEQREQLTERYARALTLANHIRFLKAEDSSAETTQGRSIDQRSQAISARWNI